MSYLKIECVAGESINELSHTAQRLANLMQINVEFRFNDVNCVASPGGSARRLASDYRQISVDEKDDHKFAFSRRGCDVSPDS